jgi:Protein of unknown function (DUF3339)
MIDITGPKVLGPAILFALLSPHLVLALPPGQPLAVQTAFHAFVFTIIYWIFAKIFKVSVTRADLIVPGIIFIVLTPGILLTLPPGAGGYFRSGETSPSAVSVHTLVYAMVLASARWVAPNAF